MLFTAFLFTRFPETAIAQTQFLCFANGGVATPARVEGLSESVGDYVLNCMGGTPTAAGSPIPPVNIQIFLNTSLTSRILSNGWSEALLLIDEPPPLSQRVCGTSGDAETGGVCTITGTGNGLGVYDGTPGRPNVFQGMQTTSNSITFLGIPVDPPGAGSRVIRITNIRADANALGVGVPPTPIVETVSPNPPLPVSNPSQTVAFIQQGITSSVSAVPSFSQCVSQNRNLARDSTQSGTSQFSARFAENFATAFKRRNVATSTSTPTALASQNDLTVGTYNTETSFLNMSFPAIAGRGNLGLAGLADQGTRLLISFANIPAGVSLFSHVSPTVSGGTDVVRRVATDSVGGGVYSPVSGNASGIAPIALAGGSGFATYEVIQSDPTTFATVNIPIYAAYDATSALPALGTGVIFANLAPLSSVITADTIAPIPRFASTGSALNAFSIIACIPVGKTDFDGDGKTDIVWQAAVGGDWIFFMNGASVVSSQPLPPVAPGWVLAGIGDFNGDGHADLLWRNTADATQYWIFLMNGATVIGGGPLTVAAGYAPTQIADFNGDGNADILWENATGGRWIFFMNGASILSAQAVPPAAPGWVIVGVGDFNGDGKADILWQNGAAPTQYWIYLMSGSSVIGGGGFTVADGYYPTQIADFDGDLKSDILFENGTPSRWIYFMNGASVSSGAPAPAAATGWSVVGTGDFNGDHRADLLWQNSADPTQYWIYLMNGASVIGGGGFVTAPGYVPIVH
jgi:hypothetical protein